jgi:hypothetical protein
MDTSASYSDQLRRYLKRILRRTAALHVASGLVSFIALGAWVFLALIVWTGTSSAPSLGLATFVGRAAVAVLVVLFVYFVVWPLIRMPRLHQLAAEVEERKDLRELLRAAFEFSNDQTATERYSPDLVREVIRQAVDRISGLEVRFLFLTRKDLALMPVAYGALVVLLLVSLFNPALLMQTGKRIASPREVAAADHRANIRATPGNVTVLAGSDVTVAGLDLGRTREAVTVAYNLAEDFWKTEPTEKVEPVSGTPGEAAFSRYEYTFAGLRHTVSYYFQSGDYRSDTYTITVVHRPILADLEIRLTPPAYTGEPEAVLTDNGGNVQALEGTRVAVEGTANNGLAAAWVRFDEKGLEPAQLDGRVVSFGFTALEDGHYSVLLEDTMGFKTDDPLVYAVEVFQDHAPSLEVVDPGADTELPRNQKLTVGFIASDDYGVQSAAIYHRRGGESEFQRVGVPLGAQKSQRDVAAAYEWDLSATPLFPGNYIEYCVEVADNNVVTGPGVTRSRTYQITVPTMAQLYDNVQEEEAQRSDMLEAAIDDSKAFRERLEKITREFIKTEQMEWSQKKEIDKAMEKQASAEEKLDDIKQSLDETLQKMSDNEMTSQEIGEKLEEIRELLEEIDSQELKKYMEELQQAVEKLSPEDIKKALENLEISTEEMLEKLERTASLLKQIQKEQQMEELVRKSQDLMNEQKDLGDDTADADAGDEKKMDELAERQDELAKKADEFKEAVDKMGETSDDQQVAQQMQELSQQMDEEQGPQQNMQQASKQLQQQQQQGAMQQQQQAMDKLISLFQRTQQAQQAMQSNQMQQMAVNYQKFARRTLDLSFKQEALAQLLTAEKEEGAGSGVQDAAQTQMSYLRATEKVADEIMKMAGMSLQVPPALMDAIGQTLDHMQNSVLFLEQNKSFMSTAYANNAVQTLNEATIEMLRSAQQCSQGNPRSQGSGQSAMQMMQQLIPRQQDVLQQTQSMMEMQALGEQLRQERQAALERLAGQQRSLKEVAEEIQKSMKENPENTLGRLDRTIEDMEAVVEALRRGDLDEDLINREQRIMSRLLDAQRSVNTRDYEKKRESTTGADVFSRSLGDGKQETVSQSLREEIRRAMQLKAPGEFEELIKLYFRALAEESVVAPKVESN